MTSFDCFLLVIFCYAISLLNLCSYNYCTNDAAVGVQLEKYFVFTFIFFNIWSFIFLIDGIVKLFVQIK